MCLRLRRQAPIGVVRQSSLSSFQPLAVSPRQPLQRSRTWWSRWTKKQQHRRAITTSTPTRAPRVVPFSRLQRRENEVLQTANTVLDPVYFQAHSAVCRPDGTVVVRVHLHATGAVWNKDDVEADLGTYLKVRGRSV